VVRWSLGNRSRGPSGSLARLFHRRSSRARAGGAAAGLAETGRFRKIVVMPGASRAWPKAASTAVDGPRRTPADRRSVEVAGAQARQLSIVDSPGRPRAENHVGQPLWPVPGPRLEQRAELRIRPRPTRSTRGWTGSTASRPSPPDRMSSGHVPLSLVDRLAVIWFGLASRLGESRGHTTTASSRPAAGTGGGGLATRVLASSDCVPARSGRGAGADVVGCSSAVGR